MAAGNHNCVRNLKNAVIAFLVPLPSIFFYITFLTNHHTESPSRLWNWCLRHPLLLANALFFINVNCVFWLIGTLQSNHWMIDPYWTVIPVMLVHFFANHPLASNYNWWRSWIVILMTWVWSLRLSHNYFRREKWQWGAREDWRFADMRLQYGQNWWWISFFTVYLPQQIFLIGLCLPMYVIHSVNKPLNLWDIVALSICVAGIIVAYFADTQLHEFVTRNCKLKQLGEAVVPNLDQGLWRYSRHPNYFGEQLWWWGLGLFAWNLGYGWSFIGAFVNSLCLGYVTLLVEERMIKQEYRAEAYRLYQKTTSVWIPWFNSSSTLETKTKSS
ncbi:unnamed protein product [Rhodiola kirilowii]